MRLIILGITLCSIAVTFVVAAQDDEALLWEEAGSISCQEFEDEANDLKEKLEKLQNQFKNAKGAISSEINDLTDKNNKAQAAINEIVRQVQALNGSNADLSKAKAQVQALTNQLQALKSTNSQLQTKATNLQQQVQSLTATNKQNTDQLNSLRAQVQALKVANDKKDKDLVALRDKIRALGDVKALFDKSKADLAALQQKLQQNKDALASCNTQTNNINSQNGVCQSSLNTQRQTLNNIPPEGCSLPRRSGGRCAGKYVRWVDTWGKHDVSFDVAVNRVNSVDQCRQLCLQDARCESADYLDLTCYLNGRRDSLRDNSALLFLNFECC